MQLHAIRRLSSLACGINLPAKAEAGFCSFPMSLADGQSSIIRDSLLLAADDECRARLSAGSAALVQTGLLLASRFCARKAATGSEMQQSSASRRQT